MIGYRDRKDRRGFIWWTFALVFSEGGETDAARIYCGGLEIPIDVAGDDRWQAELCAEFEAARSDGASDAQRSIANGQRVRNRQPEGGFRGSGNSPRTNAFRRLRRSSSMCGAAARSACV